MVYKIYLSSQLKKLNEWEFNYEKQHSLTDWSIGYICLHRWLKRWSKWLTKDTIKNLNTCQFCGKTNLNSRQIHWANKSGLYKKSFSDFYRLCCSCHRKYDNKKRIKNNEQRKSN